MTNEQDSAFTPLTNDYHHNTSTLKDQHELIKIENKTPILKNIGKIVQGETNSNILTFEIERFFDNVDLSTKGIQFVVKTDDGILVEPATNLQYNDKYVRFSWIMSHFATNRKEVTVAIEFYGTVDNDNDYTLKTTPFTIDIEDTLNSGDMNVYTVSENLYINLVNRVIKIENKISGNTPDAFATKKDITNALENIMFENEHIDFTTLMEVTENEQAN